MCMAKAVVCCLKCKTPPKVAGLTVIFRFGLLKDHLRLKNESVVEHMMNCRTQVATKIQYLLA